MLSELAESIVNKLSQRKLIIATAESCTGGMLAQYITSVSGSSDVFEYGVVTYANRIKEQELDVSHESLEAYGAVSEQVCKEMAVGVLNKSDANIGASITGIAGPGGGTPEKPVGTVYIAVATKEKTVCRRLALNGDRRKIRELTVKNILNLVKEIIDTM